MRRKTFLKAQQWVCAVTAAAGLATQTQASIVRDGSEYNVALTQGNYLSGDQSSADLALSPAGGYVVWQDNIGDTDGLSVNARRVTPALNGELGIISLATKTAGNQENPKVTLLSNGGAAFTWQGGPAEAQQIYVRVMNSAGVFLGEETAASVRTDANQVQPSITALSNGNFVVVWGADGPDGSMQGVYGALYGPTGARLRAEFQINQFTLNNQRNPVVTALADGGFAVAWVSESERSASSVDVYGRLYNASGAAKGAEFLVNASNRVASSPTIATTSAGNFTIAWCEISQDPNVAVSDQVFGEKIRSEGDQAGWDVYASGFSANGVRLTEPTRVNQLSSGSQKNPSIATVGRAQMIVWTSFGQDGDREGIAGRALSGIGAPIGDESVVNSVTVGEQLYPVVKGDGDARFVVCWSSFIGVAAGTELRAQRFLGVDDAVSLPPPGAPHVSALANYKLSVTWPSVDGYNVAAYILYVNGIAQPEINGQMTSVTGLAPGATVSFQLAYRLSDGQVSPRSAESTGRTWGEDATADGLPDDWQSQYWGANWFLWPSPSTDSDRDGVSNWSEFLAGTDPTDSQSVLRTQFIGTGSSMRLQWNTVPGQMYQIKQTLDFVTWQDFGGQRFATGTTDSVGVPAGNSLGYYRVTRIR